MSDDPQPGLTSPSMIQLGRRGLSVLGLFALLLVTLWLWLSWNNLRQSQLQRMTIVVSLAANQAQSYFDIVASQMDALALLIEQNDALKQVPLADALLTNFKAKHADLGGVSILLPSGQILASSARKPGMRLPNVLENPDWRADFNDDLAMTGLSINRPQRSYLLENWIVPLRYTVRDTSGQVRFLIQTSILMDKQQALWANIGLPPGVQIGLMREDGALLSLWPVAHGQFDPRKYPAKSLAKAIQIDVTNGFYLADNERWRDQRKGVYQRLRSYPAYAFLSVSNDLLLGLWWKMVQVPIYVFLALFVLGVAIYDWIARRFSRRMQLIQKALAEGPQTGPAQLPSSGVREIDELCEALSDTQNKLEATAQNRERQLLSAADAGTYTVRMRDGVVTHADGAFLAMLGRARAEVVNHSWAALFLDDDGTEGTHSGPHVDQDMSLRVLRFLHKQGHPVWLSLAEYIEAGEGESVRQGLAINVSEREELLAKVQVHSDRLRTLWRLATERETAGGVDPLRQMLRLGLDTLGMEVGMISEQEDGVLHVRYKIGTPILFAEGQGSVLTDSLCQETLHSRRSQFIEDLAVREEFAASRLVADWHLRVYISSPIWAGEQIFGTLTFFDRRLHSQPFSEEDKVFVELLAAWFGKVLFEQRQHTMLETMAMTDSLTGLSNRRAAETQLSGELARAKRAEEPFAVAVCDLDRFKLLNDHFGHSVGDEVLQHVSNIMRGALREGDWVARWGGEEFIVFLHRSTGQEAFNAMERLREEIKHRPLHTQHGKLELTASFGIGTFRGGETNITQILSEADGCLYEAKRRGRDRVVMSEAVSKGLLWQAGMLQHALQEKRIVAAYQVMVDLKTGQVVADEALARLIQLDGEVLPAAEFVEAAEGINLIHAVDDIIARNAIERYCTRAARGGGGQTVHFINLSPQFLARRDLLDTLLADAKVMAERAGVDFAQQQPIVLEITERQLVEDFGAIREDLKQLLEYGFRLALDDFGSGYSSFLYLAELPISFIKIEGWMVRNMQYNDRILSMVTSVVMLAKTLGMKTIAECVEDERTAEILRDMGVDWGQGFHFGYPQIAAPGTIL